MKNLIRFVVIGLTFHGYQGMAKAAFVESDYRGSTFVTENREIPAAEELVFPPFFASDSFDVGVPNNILVEGLETSPALQDFWVNMVPQQVLAEQGIDQNDLVASLVDLEFSLDSFRATNWGFGNNIPSDVSNAWKNFYADRSFVKVAVQPKGSYSPVTVFDGIKGENDDVVVIYQCLVGFAIQLEFEITGIERTNGQDSSGLQALVGQKFSPIDSAGVRPTFIKDLARSKTKTLFNQSDVDQFRAECLAN